MTKAEEKREYRRLYYSKNRENILQRMSESYQRNKEARRTAVKGVSRNNWEGKLWRSARDRSKDLGQTLSLTPADIIIPETCPIMGVPLYRGNHPEYFPGHPNTASLDRRDSSKGYTKDNVWVISWLANRMKSDATEEELNTFCNGWLKLKNGE